MANYRAGRGTESYDDYELDFDPEQIRDRSIRPSRGSHHKGKLTGHSPVATPRYVRAAKPHEPNRPLMSNSWEVLGRVIDSAMAGVNLPAVEIIRPRMRVPLLPQLPQLTRSGEDIAPGADSIGEINGAIEKFSKKTNNQRPRVTARLGELSVVTVQTRQSQTHSVGIELFGHGAQELTDENRALLQMLGRKGFGLEAAEATYQPQLEIATSSDLTAATGMLEFLQGEQLLETAKLQISPSSGGQVAGVTLGRIEF